ncbi:hypothetical protein M9H77_03242 [Catharanthus roseus]|uniref:Uncharacterized protein n=1 Tax=Catharanthus roseus TaxID=4058 RepID=A0ACC0CAV4_CATRO|nr:hypothetical protein M9H77_03242 [Catharanthus roseus]
MCRLRLLSTQISFMLDPLLLSVLFVSNFYLMIHAHVPRYFLENTLSLPVIDNLGTEILCANAYPAHHFINELSPIVVLSHLPIESSINLSIEDIDKGIEECFESGHNSEGKGSFGLDLEVVGSLTYGQVHVRGHVIDFSPANIAHYLNCPHFSDIEETGLEEEADFDKVTKVLTGDTGAVWPETNRLNSNLMKMPYRALFRRINRCTVIFRNILRQIDQNKANTIDLLCACLIFEYILGCKVLSMPFDSWVRALDPLVVMPKIVAHGVVPPSPTPSTPGHTNPGRFTTQQASGKKQLNLRMASPSLLAPSHEGLCSSLVFDLKQCQRGSVETVTQIECGHTFWLCDGTKLQVLGALCIGIILGNLVNLEESVIMSCNIEVQLRRFEIIRKGQNPK